MSVDLYDLGTLIQLRVKLFLRRSLSRYTRAARTAAPIRLGLFVLVAVWVLGTLVIPLTGYFVHTLGNPAGRAALAPSLGFDLSAFEAMIFFYAVTTLAITFTSRSDLQLLLITPVSPFVALGEKIISTSLTFSLIMVIGAPGLIGIGNALHAGPAYDLLVVLVILVTPLAPVSLAMLLLLAVLRWLPPSRVRAAVAVLGLIVGMSFFIGMQLFSASRSAQPSSLPSLPATLPTTWLGQSLATGALGETGRSLGYFLSGAALALLLFGLATSLSSQFFVTGVTTYQQVARRRNRRPIPAADRHQTAISPAGSHFGGNPFTALLQTDWLSLRRDPQGLVTLAYPLVIVAFYAYRTFSNPSSLTALGGVNLLNGSLYAILTLTVILLVSSIAPLIINREGYALYLLALAPLRVRTILLARWTICILPVLLVTELILGIGSVYLSLPVAQALLAGFAVAAMIVTLTAVDIAVNLLWPRFEARTGRRSGSYLAALVSFFGDLVVGGALCVLLVATMIFWGTAAALVTGLALFLIAALITAGAALAGIFLLGGFLNGTRPIPYSSP